jgi:hypothetical protein
LPHLPLSPFPADQLRRSRNAGRFANFMTGKHIHNADISTFVDLLSDPPSKKDFLTFRQFFYY